MEPNPPRDKGQDHEPGFIQTPITTEADSVRTQVKFDERHQGWMDIPHGGILMSMFLELVHRGLTPPLFRGEGDILRIGFRLGGPPLSIRDSVEVGARREDGTIRGWVKKEKDGTASLKASIRHHPPINGFEQLNMDPIHATLERIENNAGKGSIPLPYSRSCFVCGSERNEPGLERRFFCVEGGKSKIAFTYIGLDPDDRDRFHRFRLDDGQAHPGTLISVLDETLGWSGFVETLQGGVTVKLEVDIHRPADPGEKMLCFGICTGVRGRDPQRQFWFSEGAILPMGDGDLTPIMTARGQWLSIPNLTEEMKQHLIPRDWLQRWFGPEGG
jgi:acyl-coenzyme A thioesterase PaaI-like protein